MGHGRYTLIKNIEKTKSLKKSAELLGISYKTAFNYIRKIENNIGKRIIETERGGKGAGGSTKLNKTGKELVKKYEEALKKIK